MLYASLLFLVPLGVVAQNVGAFVEVRPAAAPQPQFSAPESKPEDLAVVEGRVLDAATVEPLRKVNLILRRADPNPNSGTIPASYSSISDTGGKFAIKDIEPGRYRLTVTRSGYATGEYGSAGPGRPGTIVSLGKAQKLTDLTVKMTQHGVISGRIVDRDGDPLMNVGVQLMRYQYVNGRKQLTPAANVGSTNDLGEYRLYGIAPGRYYLSATYREMQFETARSTGGDEEFATTYYPGTFDISTAAEINVNAGAQTRVDLTLAKTRSARITGRVVNTAAPAAPNVSVMLTPRGGAINPFTLGRSAPTGSNARFELRGVLPGSYYLTANASFGGKSYAARVPIEVGSSNIEDMTLTISGGVDIQGRIRVDGNGAAPANLQVTLRPREPGIIFGSIPISPVGGDGTFTLQNVGPDTYTVFFSGLPEGYFVKSIRSGDTDVLATGLSMMNGVPGNLDIVLSPDAGEVSGSVQNPKTQQPMAGATVVLVPAERNRLEQQTFYKTTTTDQSGSFTMKSITPGDYKAYAWEGIENGAYMDPDFVKLFETKGESVSVREKSRLNLQLTLIPSDATQNSR